MVDAGVVYRPAECYQKGRLQDRYLLKKREKYIKNEMNLHIVISICLWYNKVWISIEHYWE